MIRIKSKEEQGAPKKKHGCLWSIILLAVVYVGFCGWLGYTLGDSSVSLEENSVYRLEMKGQLQERGQEENPFAALMEEIPGAAGTQEVVGLDDLLANIRLAKTDSRIKGICLEGGELAMAPASAKALRDALVDYKQSGKFLIAYAPSYSQMNYYVASVADRICLNPSGSVNWNGLSAQKMYYTRLMEKIGVEMQILKVGTFKSAVEPYFRTSMSEADKAQTMQYVRGIWDEMVQAVSADRGLTVAELDACADRFMGLQKAEQVLACGLVDTLVYVQSVDSILYQLCGKKPNKIGTADLAKVERESKKATNEIAVVYAEGAITDETGDGIVGKDMIKTLNKVMKAEDVKAVVLRVNSPGGSANASEQIWHAVRLLQTDKHVPVVVSMGDYAASGGYYISCEADYIFAEPTTLTGSIGIFGTVPNFGKLREKVGLDIDGVKTHAHSDLESNMVYKGMNAEERALMQRMIEDGYDLFTRRCAEGRHMTQDDIKKIAEGRVWLGKDAVQIGLVDELGNIDAAVAKAAELAALSEDYVLVSYPEKKDFLTQLMESLDNSTEEERLVMKVREFCSKPRIMALMDEIVIR